MTHCQCIDLWWIPEVGRLQFLKLTQLAVRLLKRYVLFTFVFLCGMAKRFIAVLKKTTSSHMIQKGIKKKTEWSEKLVHPEVNCKTGRSG